MYVHVIVNVRSRDLNVREASKKEDVTDPNGRKRLGGGLVGYYYVEIKSFQI